MGLLASIQVTNYRCFQDHLIELGRPTILVGKNNAGKSTLIEAIRLVSVALKRFNNPVAHQAPRWLDDYAPGPGQRMDLSRLAVVTDAVFYHYGEPPAIIVARFSDGSCLRLFVGPDGEAHAVFNASDGRAIRSRRDIGGARIPQVAILPQVGPFEREERILDADYVRQNLDSYLAPRHFRNQLNLFGELHFNSFRELVERSWPGVRINGLDIIEQDGRRDLRLMIRDGAFVAEVGWMGHGLQMWLQTLWFIERSRNADTIVLDEPDVFMHPDLQRRLIRMLFRGQTGVLVATHSTEILSEVDASNVLVLDRVLPRSSYATSLPAVQKVIEVMGSAQNLQIARLWKARALILVEGQDMKILRRVHDLLYPNSPAPLDATPNWAIGGWNGWSSAIGSVVALQNAVHENIRCYCIFDSDYHLPEEVNVRKAQALQRGIELHIWSAKEIENYLIKPSLISRVISRGLGDNEAPDVLTISEEISRLANELIPDVQDAFVTHFMNFDRASGPGTASRRAREYVTQRLNEPRGALGLVPGKELISRLSDWSSRKYGFSFGVNALINSLRADEIDAELAHVVRVLADSRNFQTQA